MKGIFRTENIIARENLHFAYLPKESYKNMLGKPQISTPEN